MPRKRGLKAWIKNRLDQTLDNADEAIDATSARALELLGEILDGVQVETSIDWSKQTAVSKFVFLEEDDEQHT